MSCPKQPRFEIKEDCDLDGGLVFEDSLSGNIPNGGQFSAFDTKHKLESLEEEESKKREINSMPEIIRPNSMSALIRDSQPEVLMLCESDSEGLVKRRSEHISEENPQTTIPVKPKRGRGRPPKIREPVTIGSQPLGNSSAHPMLGKDSSSSLKPKRGSDRPPKIREPAPCNDTATVFKRVLRGRPTKIKMSWPEEDSDVPGIKHRGENYFCPKDQCTWFEEDLLDLLIHLLQHQGLKLFKCKHVWCTQFSHPKTYIRHMFKDHDVSVNLSDCLESISCKIASLSDINLKHCYKGVLDELKGPSMAKLQAAKQLLSSAIPVNITKYGTVRFKCPAEGCPNGNTSFKIVPFVEHINKCHVLIKPFRCPKWNTYTSTFYRLNYDQSKAIHLINQVPLYKHFFEEHPNRLGQMGKRTSSKQKEQVLDETMDSEDSKGSTSPSPKENISKRMASFKRRASQSAPSDFKLCFKEIKDGKMLCIVKDCHNEFNASMLVDIIDHYCTVHRPESKDFLCPLKAKNGTECSQFNSILDLFNHVVKSHRQMLSFSELLAKSTLNDETLKVLCEKMVVNHAKVQSELAHFDTSINLGRKVPTVYQCPGYGCKLPPMKSLFDLFIHYLTHVSFHESARLFKCSLSHCNYGTNVYSSMRNHMYIKHWLKVDRLYIFKRVNEEALDDLIARQMYKEYRESAIDPPGNKKLYQAAQMICQTTARALPHQTTSGHTKVEVLFDCPFPDCEMSCPAINNKLIGHINNVHLKTSPFQCSACDYLSSSPEGLSKHYLDKHGKKRTQNDIMMAVPAFEKTGKHLFNLLKKTLRQHLND